MSSALNIPAANNLNSDAGVPTEPLVSPCYPVVPAHDLIEIEAKRPIGPGPISPRM